MLLRMDKTVKDSCILARKASPFFGLVFFFLLAAGCGFSVQSAPTAASLPTLLPPSATPAPPLPTLTPALTSTAAALPDRAVLYYLREMLENPTAQAMLNLTPPEMLRDLHLELAARKAALELVQAQMRRAYREGGEEAALAFVPALSVAQRDYDETLGRAYPLWQEYVAPLEVDLPISFEARYWFTGMDFTAPQDGWIVGRRGTILHYDGSDWRRLDSPLKDDLLAVDMVSPFEGWVVAAGAGDFGIRLLHLAEGQWRIEENPSRRPTIRALRAFSAQNAWLLAVTPGEAVAELWQYDGLRWQQRASVPYTSAAELHMPEHFCGWLSGANGSTVVLF
jgi:hypothetical protein